MKLFALVLASFFLFQVSTPLLCAAGCDDAMEMRDHSCCSKEKMNTCHNEQKQDEKKNAGQHSPFQAKDCCTPCCAVPMFCCYYQETSDVAIASYPVKCTGQLPSSNGIPREGFRSDCFQPPEII